MILIAIVTLTIVSADHNEEDTEFTIATELTCADGECLVRTVTATADDGTETYTDECIVETELTDE